MKKIVAFGLLAVIFFGSQGVPLVHAQEAKRPDGKRSLTYMSGSLNVRERDVSVGYTKRIQQYFFNTSVNHYRRIVPGIYLGIETHIGVVEAKNDPFTGNIFLGPTLQVMRPVTASLQVFGRAGIIGSSNFDNVLPDEFSARRVPFHNAKNYLYTGAGLEWALDDTFGLYAYGQYVWLDRGTFFNEFSDNRFHTRGVFLSVGLSF